MIGRGVGLHGMVGLCTAILAGAAMALAQPVLSPIVFALFAIALVWPIQRALEARMPQLVALLATMLVALVALLGLTFLVAWAFSRVGQWMLANAAALQALYMQKIAWLEAQGVSGASSIAGQFDMRWVVRVAQAVMAELRQVVSFLLLTLVYVMLGLLEVEVAQRQMARLGARSEVAAALMVALRRTAEKFRTYMVVRTLMSVVTGVAVWAFAYAIGLELALEWGVIALVLNYIPFIGPLVATVFPTIFAVLQGGTWQLALLVFAALQVIQFVGGSYIEPRMTGKQLAVSPFMVLVAVFVGAFFWGLSGAFIGVPLLIGALTICEVFPRSRWVAELLSGRDPSEA